MSKGKFLSTPSGWRATRFPFHLDIEAVFLSTPSGWRATSNTHISQAFSSNFYPRPPGGGRPRMRCSRRRKRGNFYPRPPGGGRRHVYDHIIHLKNFYPRPPGGGRPEYNLPFQCIRDFYPRPPGGGRHKAALDDTKPLSISIHALRVEGDRRRKRADQIPQISIHALRVEGDIHS